MKTQMRVQKILMLASLILSALVFVFALFFLTGSMGRIWYYVDGSDLINGENFFNAGQSFVGTLVTLAIVLIVLAAVMYLMGCNNRRKYYITNYIAIGLFVVFAVVVVVYMLYGISNCMNLFLNDIAWEEGANGGFNVAEQIDKQMPLKKEYLNFVLGYILCVLVLADAVLVALSTLWKVKLMKGEEKLLAESATVEEPAEEQPVKEEV